MSEEPNIADKQLMYHLIDMYRDLLAERYNFSRLSERFDLPSGIGEETIEDVKKFFLENIYPPSEEREQVDRAFDSLKFYITNPLKVWGLLGNMAAAIFRFGAQFPAALRAGFYTLEAYLDARKFEHKLLEAAKELNYTEPLTAAQFMECLKFIPRREAESFIQDVGRLFKSMSDTILLRKTISIMRDVIRTMERKPGVYPSTDVDGINLGIGVLENGLHLFKKMDSAIKRSTLQVILQNESWFLDNVYGRDDA